MGVFSLVSIEDRKEFFEKHRIFNIMGSRLKDFIVPYIPEYISGTVKDIGAADFHISGYRICVPPMEGADSLMRKKLYKAVNRCKAFGAEVIVADPSISMDMAEEDLNIRISRGNLYTPYALIDAVKTVAALMGINFNRCNICVANASTDLGRTITELLLNEALYLILCTNDKDSIMEKLDGYMMKTGLSPAVMSNYRKAIGMCDILVYTGGANLSEITSWVNKKMIIVNLTAEKVKMEKDLLIIDEVVLKGKKEPVISGEEIDQNIFLTSRVWEGALLTLSDIDTRTLSVKKIIKLGRLSKRLGLRMSSVISCGRPVNREAIYKYR